MLEPTLPSSISDALDTAKHTATPLPCEIMASYSIVGLPVEDM